MIPKYMYHYTSIETLLKILLAKKIRFTRLDLLNDPYEGKFLFQDSTNTQDQYRKLVYCSCWNADENENVGLWYMYTKMSGCRIKLKSNMFAETLQLKEQDRAFFPIGKIDPIIINGFKTDAGNIYSLTINNVIGPIKITYENSFENTYSSVAGKSLANQGTTHEFMMCDINMYEIGTRKINHWNYEHEWRFTLSPLLGIHFSESIMNETDVPFLTPEYVDIPIQQNVEQILLAPKVSDDDYEKLSLFIKDNYLTIPVNKSEIQIL